MPSEPDYRALFPASPYPYMLLDRQPNIIAANDALDAGFDHHLVKPVEVAGLVRLLLDARG
jgi:hypothetical protein